VLLPENQKSEKPAEKLRALGIFPDELKKCAGNPEIRIPFFLSIRKMKICTFCGAGFFCLTFSGDNL